MEKCPGVLTKVVWVRSTSGYFARVMGNGRLPSNSDAGCRSFDEARLRLEVRQPAVKRQRLKKMLPPKSTWGCDGRVIPL